MSSVIFPGTPGVNVSTPDANLLGANSAHIVQRNPWAGAGIALVDEGPQPDGWGQLSATVTAAGNGSMRATAGVPAPVDYFLPATYRVIFSLDDLVAAGDRTFRALFGGDTLIVAPTVNVSPSPTPQWVIIDGTNGDALTHRDMWIETRAWDGTETFKISKIMLTADTSLTGFVPSLRIEDTLGETIDPPGMPIGYADDGTPLTVGESWAGNGVLYQRHDGDTATGPIVCEFDAADAGNAVQ